MDAPRADHAHLSTSLFDTDQKEHHPRSPPAMGSTPFVDYDDLNSLGQPSMQTVPHYTSAHLFQNASSVQMPRFHDSNLPDQRMYQYQQQNADVPGSQSHMLIEQTRSIYDLPEERAPYYGYDTFTSPTNIQHGGGPQIEVPADWKGSVQAYQDYRAQVETYGWHEDLAELYSFPHRFDGALTKQEVSNIDTLLENKNPVKNDPLPRNTVIEELQEQPKEVVPEKKAKPVLSDDKALRMLKSARKPSMANIPGPYSNMPVDVDLTTVEILTFFPPMLCDVKCVERLMHGGWTNHMITHILNTTRDWSVDGRKEMFSRSSVLTTTKRAMAATTGSEDWSEKRWRNSATLTPVPDYTASQFVASKLKEGKQETLISSLATNVVQMPEGDDRGALTEAVALVKAFPDLDRNLSELGELLTEQAIRPMPYTSSVDTRCQLRWTKDAAKVSTTMYDTYLKHRFSTTTKRGRSLIDGGSNNPGPVKRSKH
ncbi:hypothetical protein EJ08DRAFT_656534 [Tothia fuscella]|uniref:Uncharacterized protein n=1 Tax=Tothia fuscella TaxID=1048955 RepID=A0A9P4P1H4_9PEZI|nr:hypothetical protein EJ08DRAFT_656534 [Tothia fuscella]